jgi:phage antirepressor YoqD-like protein
MQLKDFLEKNKIINAAELSRLMYPEKKVPKQYFNNKLKGISTAPGRAPQQITPDDIAKAKNVLLSILKDAEKIE